MKIKSEVIYLDNAFIVDAYQQIQGKSAAVKYIKTTDVSVGINTIAKAGASLKESFEYPISAHTMYEEINSNLNDIDTIALNDDNKRNLPELFWLEGLFGIVQMTKNSGEPNEIRKYVFSAATKGYSFNLFLSTNDVYFSSGYDQLLSQADAFSDTFIIEAKMLLKFLGTTPDHSLASPMIIIKKGNWEFK